MSNLAVVNNIPRVAAPAVIEPNKYLPTPRSRVLTKVADIELPVIIVSIKAEDVFAFEAKVSLYKHAVKCKQNTSTNTLLGRKWYGKGIYGEIETVVYHIEYVNRKELESGFLTAVHKMLLPS